MENEIQLLSPNMICHLLMIHYLRTPLPDKPSMALSFQLPPFLYRNQDILCLGFSQDSQASFLYAFNNIIHIFTTALAVSSMLVILYSVLLVLTFS